MTSAAQNKQTTLQMWWDLYEEHDYDAVGRHFAPDGHYTDMATSDDGGRGPEAIAARLRIGLEPLKEHFHCLYLAGRGRGVDRHYARAILGRNTCSV